MGGYEVIQKPQQSKKEYSKLAITAIIILWFIGAIFGMIIVTVQAVNDSYSIGLGELLMYIGAPMTSGILGYLVKSAVENKEKVKQLNITQRYE